MLKKKKATGITFRMFVTRVFRSQGVNCYLSMSLFTYGQYYLYTM